MVTSCMAQLCNDRSRMVGEHLVLFLSCEHLHADTLPMCQLMGFQVGVRPARAPSEKARARFSSRGTCTSIWISPQIQQVAFLTHFRVQLLHPALALACKSNKMNCSNPVSKPWRCHVACEGLADQTCMLAIVSDLEPLPRTSLRTSTEQIKQVCLSDIALRNCSNILGHPSGLKPTITCFLLCLAEKKIRCRHVLRGAIQSL